VSTHVFVSTFASFLIRKHGPQQGRAARETSRAATANQLEISDWAAAEIMAEEEAAVPS